MFRAMEAEGMRFDDLLAPDFQLVLDTSDLPVGRLEFDLGAFIKQVEKRLDEGTEIVHLSRKDAAEWGLRITEAAH